MQSKLLLNMSEEKHWFEKVTLAMENHKLGVQYGAYSVAVLGLAVALRSVRPFKKFVSPSQIPASFIECRMRLNGRVLRIDPSVGSTPTTLAIDHYPVVSLLRNPSSGLPVQISSIDLSANGISWLQHVVVGKDVGFTLLKANPNCVSCIVDYQDRNIGLDLVSLGFASVAPIEFTLQKDKKYLSYYKSLLAAENKAEKKGVGMWAGELTNYQIIAKVMNKMRKPITDMLKVASSHLTRKKVSIPRVIE